MIAFLYVKFISPEKGFGVFAGQNIPYTPPVVERPPGALPSDPDPLPVVSPECLGSYGGIICTEIEACHPKTVYALSFGDLNRSAEDRPLPRRRGKKRRSNKKKPTEKYVRFSH